MSRSRPPSPSRLAHVAHVAHLARRCVGSLSRTSPSTADLTWVGATLTAAEMDLWQRFGPADRRHTIEVARRFVALRPGATTAEIAGALLHDIGKLDSGLGTFGRVLATVVGPRTDRFRRYHDHEEIGATMLAGLGSDPTTVELVRGAGDAAASLRAADDV